MFLVHPWPDPLEGNDVPWSGRIEKAQFLDPYQLVQTPSVPLTNYVNFGRLQNFPTPAFIISSLGWINEENRCEGA